MKLNNPMKGEVSAGWTALFGGIVLVAVMLFAHQELFAFVDEVFFTGVDAAVKQTNVSDGWGEISALLMWGSVFIFAIIGIIAMLIGRGE